MVRFSEKRYLTVSATLLPLLAGTLNLLFVVRQHDDELPACQHLAAGGVSLARLTHGHVKSILKPCEVVSALCWTQAASPFPSESTEPSTYTL